MSTQQWEREQGIKNAIMLHAKFTVPLHPELGGGFQCPHQSGYDRVGNAVIGSQGCTDRLWKLPFWRY